MAPTIRSADLDDPAVVALLETHTARARAETARGSAHALDLEALRVPEIAVFTLYDGDQLLGVGALMRLSATHGEIKSMHVAETARRTGAGSIILAHLIEEARRQGMSRASLETGSWPYFTAARALYARHGFEDCGPFEGYAADANSVFMTLSL
jgi:putative acetyltransferase